MELAQAMKMMKNNFGRDIFLPFLFQMLFCENKLQSFLFLGPKILDLIFIRSKINVFSPEKRKFSNKKGSGSSEKRNHKKNFIAFQKSC